MEPGSEPPPRPSPAPRAKLTRAEWGLILVLAAVNFTHIIDFVIIMPLGDRLMRELEGVGTEQFGQIISAYGLAAFVASIAGSFVIDRFDRKAVLLTMYAGFAASTLFCGLAPNYHTLLLSRALAGVFGGLAASAIMAVIGDAFPAEKRGRATGAVMSAFAVASIGGLPAGLTLANWLGRGAPFVALAGLSVLVWLAALAFMPRMRGHLTAARRPPLAQFGAVVSEPRHLVAFVFTMSLVLGSFTVASFIGPYFTTTNGWQEDKLSVIYLVAGVCTLVSMNVVGRLADRFRKRVLFRVLGTAALASTLALTNLPPAPLAVGVLAATLYMVFASGRMVPAQAMLLSCAAPRVRGAFLSLNTAVQHLGTGLAPMVAGAIMERTPDGKLVGYPVVGLVAGGSALLSLVLAGWIRPAPAPPVVAEPKHEPPEARREPKPAAV